MPPLSLGAFYNPHLAPVILDKAESFGHLAMADPPDRQDPAWPRIRDRFTLLLHDYLGQLSEPFGSDEVTRARALLDQYRSPWAAEHLQRIRPSSPFPATGPAVQLDYVFPPVYTEDLLADYIRHAKAFREQLGVPLAMEPIPTYLHLDIAQLSEPAFLHRFCDGSGCHLLLDLAHVWLSARYAGLRPRDLLLEYPLRHAIELHVAGCARDPDLDGPWIAPVLPDQDILDLAELAVKHAPELRAITFDAFSPLLSSETLLAGIGLLHERFGVKG